MSMNLVTLLYLIASVCFIQALKGLSHPTTSRRGNLFGMVGMAIAVATTVGLVFKLGAEIATTGVGYIVVGLLVGGTAGSIMAKRVEMTKMPELVAFMHSMIGLAAVFIAIAAVVEPQSLGIVAHLGDTIPTGNRLELFLGAAIGAITFSGSVIAFGKLSGKYKFRLFQGTPVQFSGQHLLNLVLGLATLGLGLVFMFTGNLTAFAVMLALAFVLGVLIIIPIGGADMPVVVSMLNSYSGWAAAGIGFSLNNSMLIIAGSLVGSSGAILSYIMCKAMNRSFFNVILGGGGGAPPPPAPPGGGGGAPAPPPPPPPPPRLEDLAGLGLHQQADIATELAEATGHQAEHAGEFHQAVALGVPGLFGQSQAQLLGQRRGHRQGLFAERGERPRGAAELQHQQARAQLAQALAVPGQGTEQAGELHAQGHRGGVLQPGAPGQRRVGMPFGLVRQDLGKTLQILLEQGQRTAQLQHQAAVHGVLAGGAEMHVALGLGVARRHLAAQRLDQRDRRVAGSGDRLGQRQRVVQFGAAGRLDRRHRRRGNHPGARLGAGQGGLEVEHALQAAAVGEHRAHRRRREIGIEQLVGGYVAHRFSFSRPVRARRSGS